MNEKGMLNSLLGYIWKRNSKVKSLIRIEDENMIRKVTKFDSRPKMDSNYEIDVDEVDDEDVNNINEFQSKSEEQDDDFCSIQLSLSGYHLNPEYL